ncbi:hypothetical protein LCGC14_1407440 [marine sediment metagenome]|uniref:Uncharacterized protein n=1 Tax=marine sediment metagenome TaxID=412755 RepID=A0A0F9JV83_9ZZZZ
MTTDAEIKSKVGANVSTDVTEAMYDAWVLQEESVINVFIRINFSDLITAGLNADVAGIFSSAVSSRVARWAIMYDMSGYTSRAEAEDMVTQLRDDIQLIFSLLRDKKYTTFITKA